MAKRPTKPETHSWAVYHLKGTPAQFVGIVDDAPDRAERDCQGDRGIRRAGEPARAPDSEATGLIRRRRPACQISSRLRSILPRTGLAARRAGIGRSLPALSRRHRCDRRARLSPKKARRRSARMDQSVPDAYAIRQRGCSLRPRARHVEKSLSLSVGFRGACPLHALFGKLPIFVLGGHLWCPSMRGVRNYTPPGRREVNRRRPFAGTIQGDVHFPSVGHREYPMNRSNKYRRTAADCYALAQHCSPLSKATMLAMSQSWLVLADHADHADQSSGISGRGPGRAKPLQSLKHSRPA
jgi:hypothetical protein